MFDYPVILEPDDNGTTLVSFPDIPEAHTFGDNTANALAHAKSALETALELYVEDRRNLPRPSKGDFEFFVAPGSIACAKLAIYQSMLHQRVTKAELGRRLGVHPPQVDRLLDLGHSTKFELIERALAVLGLRVSIEIAKAA